MRYYREWKDEPGKMEEVTRQDVVRELETRGYHAAGTVADMEADAEKGLFPWRQTDWAIYSVTNN